MRYLYPVAEYLRPWRLLTLCLGLVFLIAGALYSGLPDWDIPVSLLMALCAYLTAAPTLRVVLERRWQHAHYAAFWTWYSVDGSYFTYWGLVDPSALDFRLDNAGVSLFLYALCGVVWYHRKPVPQFIEDDWFIIDDESQYH